MSSGLYSGASGGRREHKETQRTWRKFSVQKLFSALSAFLRVPLLKYPPHRAAPPFSLLALVLVATPLHASPNSSKECSICHYRWVDDFLSEEPKEFQLSFPQDRVVAWEMMCYSCHDGSIIDSRFRVWETSRHKAGVRPSDKVSIPEDFPLDIEGRMQCATCHSAHGVDTRNADMATTIFLRAPNTNSSLCKRCHTDKNRGPKEGNHPVDIEFEPFPDKILEAGGKAGNEDDIQTVICESCHTPHGSNNDHFLVIPNSSESISQSQLCDTCHTLSPDIGNSDALRRYSHPVDIEIGGEAELPEKWDNDEEPRLGGGKMVNCRTCHSPHAGTEDNQLLVAQDKRGLCLTCHTSKKTIFGTKHDIAEFHPEEKNADGIRANKGGTCSACHFMHKGYGPKMWAQKSSAGSLDKQCFSCHAKGEMAEKALTGKQSHPVGAQPDRATWSDELPLFRKGGKKDPKGEVTCPSCHDVHRWAPDTDDKGGKEAEANSDNSFLRQSGSGSKLCTTCHKEQASVRRSEHDLSLIAPKSRNVRKQSPARSGICGTCHLVHNAAGKKLWAREEGEGGDAIERLCASCHAEDRMAEAKTTGEVSHPLGEPPNGSTELPLHTPEGKKSREGGVTCASCHDVHRWEAGIKSGPGEKEIEGTRLTSFLRLPNDDNAKLCEACHGENTLVVGTDHDLRITAPGETNSQRQTTEESGVCGACHLVHNAGGNNLWAKETGSGKHRNESLCTSCHEKEKAAKKKALPGPKHPMDKKVSEARDTLKRETAHFFDQEGQKTPFPLFEEDGSRSPSGDISCSTCHNPHRWNPEEPSPNAKENLEGKGSDSFLRKSNLPGSQLCTTCHTSKRYVRGTEHDLTVTAPDEKNILGQTVAESGLCSACHLPHGANGQDYLLWAKKPGEGSSLLPERVCLSCHAPNEAGKEKVVKRFSHPQTISATEQKRMRDPNYAPLYDKEGRKADAGIITCPTCHDPHNWTPGRPRPGSGKNIEGNSRNSFLRMKSGKNICRNCHGLDSLARYKYFHSPWIGKEQPVKRKLLGPAPRQSEKP